MEGTDGMRFLARVKEIAPDTGVIVITGFATPESAKESFRKGAYDFVAKPFKLSDIVDIVRQTGRKTPCRRQDSRNQKTKSSPPPCFMSFWDARNHEMKLHISSAASAAGLYGGTCELDSLQKPAM